MILACVMVLNKLFCYKSESLMLMVIMKINEIPAQFENKNK